MISIRPATPEDAAFVWQVQSTGWQQTYQGILSDEFLAGFAKRDGVSYWRNALAKDNSTTAILQYNGQDAGFMAWGENDDANYPYAHELFAMYVLKEYQQYGLGKAAIAYIKQQLQTDALIVWTLAENPSNAFYNKVGKQLSYTKLGELAGKQHLEYAFEV